MECPELYRIHQIFPRPQEKAPYDAVLRELTSLGLKERIRPGQRIAITAGSRGIANIVDMLRAVVDFVRTCGGEPFLVSAMGSHGGGTVEGQAEVLKGYGITEQSVGAPIKIGTGPETVFLGKSEMGRDVYFDKYAAEADGIIVMNRCKTHTLFTVDNESGLLKKLVVGLGKERGAQLFHSLGQAELSRLLPDMAAVSLAKKPILAGLGIVENGYEETAKVLGVKPEDFIAKDAELLAYCKSLLPRLPIDEMDLLIVDEMGKNYSGSGMDTKVIGRFRLDGIPDMEKPRPKKLVCLDLSDESHGNANGLNLPDVVTRRLVNKVDFAATYANCIATTFIQRAATPATMETDREAIDIAIRSLGPEATPDIRVVRIKNTLHLDEVWVSASALRIMEAERPGQFAVIEGPTPLAFDATGNLLRDYVHH